MKVIRFLSIIAFAFILSGCSLAFMPGGSQTGRQLSAKGVYKSFDKGQNWLEQNILAQSDQTLNRLNTNKLVFDIFDSSIIYRSTDKGLFISQDAGSSWRRLNQIPVSDFVLNPKTRDIIYLASANNVYKTTDNGKNWQLVYSDARQGVSIVSLAISYFDTSNIYLLASDGSLLASLDWGDSWKTIYNFKNNTVKELLINPFDSQIIYVAVSNGLFRTLDQGASWQEILSGQSSELPGIEKYRSLSFGPRQEFLFYLSDYGILQSLDYGDSWQPISLITSPNTVQPSAATFNPTQSDEIYYAVGNVLYHTVDRGRNWKTKVIPIPAGAYASQLLVDRQNPDIVYLGISQ